MKFEQRELCLGENHEKMSVDLRFEVTRNLQREFAQAGSKLMHCFVTPTEQGRVDTPRLVEGCPEEGSRIYRHALSAIERATAVAYGVPIQLN